MKRIFNDFAYTDAPRENCWWDQTCAATDRSALEGDVSCDVAIVGGGFTGLSAALRLAEAGYSAVVLENRYVGWGAYLRTYNRSSIPRHQALPRSGGG
ncbi:MAG: hypothetical protein CMN07_10950, partial [Roseobacter sp.]|nr:hypothetical protein [Roseobacter sp.]